MKSCYAGVLKGVDINRKSFLKTEFIGEYPEKKTGNKPCLFDFKPLLSNVRCNERVND